MSRPPIDPTATSAQLKADIDSGLTGDKVAGFDPAAAPLGTDEEAGGAATRPEQLAAARDTERATAVDHDPSRTGKAGANAAPDGDVPKRGPTIIGAVLLGAGAALVLALVLLAFLLHG